MIRFEVPDMSCGACARRVTQAVQGVDPGAAVEVHTPSREVTVTSTADPGALLAALAEAGYPARPAA